jgi:hypothetical protein
MAIYKPGIKIEGSHRADPGFWERGRPPCESGIGCGGEVFGSLALLCL